MGRRCCGNGKLARREEKSQEEGNRMTFLQLQILNLRHRPTPLSFNSLVRGYAFEFRDGRVMSLSCLFVVTESLFAEKNTCRQPDHSYNTQ